MSPGTAFCASAVSMSVVVAGTVSVGVAALSVGVLRALRALGALGALGASVAVAAGVGTCSVSGLASAVEDERDDGDAGIVGAGLLAVVDATGSAVVEAGERVAPACSGVAAGSTSLSGVVGFVVLGGGCSMVWSSVSTGLASVSFHASAGVVLGPSVLWGVGGAGATGTAAAAAVCSGC